MGSVKSNCTIRKLKKTNIEIVKFLGSGGEGWVFLGKLTELDQLIALKQFEVISNAEVEKQITEAVKKEMSIVKNLNHPNVVKCFTIHKSWIPGADNGV